MKTLKELNVEIAATRASLPKRNAKKWFFEVWSADEGSTKPVFLTSFPFFRPARKFRNMYEKIHPKAVVKVVIRDEEYKIPRVPTAEVKDLMYYLTN